MMGTGLKISVTTVWTSISVVLSVAIVFQIGSVFMFKNEAPKYNIPTNPFSDLYTMGVSLCAISLYRYFAYNFAKPSVEQRLKKIEPGCPDNKIDKNTRALVGSIWYTFTTVFSVLK